MAVRIKIEIIAGQRRIEETALLNSGYEAPSAQLLVPIDTAERLGLWPPVRGHQSGVRNGRRGPESLALPKGRQGKGIASDAESRGVDADIVISPLAEELKIAVESFGRAYGGSGGSRIRS